MILDVAALVVRHCALSPETARALRVAFIKTTDPTFLLFGPDQPHPLYVVKVGVLDVLNQRLAVKARLHALLPDVIARPIGVYPIGDGRGILVQSGLPGFPWFRLGDRVRTEADWMALRRRCIAQLRGFQNAVSTQTDWVVLAGRFGAPLLALAAGLSDVLGPLGVAVGAMVADAAAILEAMGPVPATWQHGDFTINNLVVDDERLGVFDLVDFGKWRVPLIDAFSLGCSIHLHATEHTRWHHLSEDLAACANAMPGADTYTSPQKAAFFTYFLLAAISDTMLRPSRAKIRLTYLEHVRLLAADLPRFVRAFDSER